jgi:2-C-methyl-D-erythritol 4-phosphate cytidylyltransferase
LHVTAILVAAGPGTRLGASQPKAFVELGGVSLLVRALNGLLSVKLFSSAIVVLPPGRVEEGAELTRRSGPWPCALDFTAGGTERQDSVRRALEKTAAAELIAIHDAARPFVAPETVRAVVEEATKHGAAIAAVPVTDTVKQVHQQGWIESTLPREQVWLAQTPQAFRADLIRAAHLQAQRENFLATDDAALVERLGVRVHVVRANPENRKITTTDDLHWAEWLIEWGTNRR